MGPEIAIVGMACRYPDAAGPDELWHNVLARRRAFRRMPDQRLPLRDYGSSDPADVDRTYVTQAAVIEGYEFDRQGYRVAAPVFREVDMAHWLALDVAAGAIADAGFVGDRHPPRDTTGVVVGNTLTGEYSRANMLRLRWPYVDRVLRRHLAREGWERERRHELLARIENDYKEPFPPVGSETLAGGLSNTIAGRICNHFDLRGGGYTVDGACAASLLAVTTACSSLVSGDLDVAIAGGVDLSLDPFELVGFARLGALAKDNMRVYDRRSEGFWPGEGCGFVVLARLQDALALGLRCYAVIRGWGVSSDGRGGITRPEVSGQRLALERAYRRAGFGIESVAYFEGHGTGTRIGDQVEVQALLGARRAAGDRPVPAMLGSIKANIGHTKAAAGIAGLIKAALAVHEQVLPPTTGCQRPLAELTAGDGLAVAEEAESWPADRPLRAGVSASGFGGTNSHLALEGAATERRQRLTSVELEARAAEQDCEVFLLAASTGEALLSQVDALASIAPALAMAELADAAAAAERRLEPAPLRAAVVAASPADLADGLHGLRVAIREERMTGRVGPGVHLSRAGKPPRVGFLFPGQGSPADVGGGLLRRRFRWARQVYEEAALEAGPDPVDTAIVQPAVVTASTAMLRVLRELRIEACVAVGHSIGELTAYHWAGAMSWEALLATARLRGRAMSRLAGPPGSMASIAAPASRVEDLLDGGVHIACLNGPAQTVVSGPAEAVERLVGRARSEGLQVSPLRVSHAFHSNLMAPVRPALASHLAALRLYSLERPVVSTVTGGRLPVDADLAGLMVRQLTRPVRFEEALEAAATEADLLVEVGPGRVLGQLAESCLPLPVYPLEAGGPSLRGLMELVAALHVSGAPVRHDGLFEGRYLKPFDLERSLSFFTNPCESRAANDPSTEDEITAEAPPERQAPVVPAATEPLLATGERDPLRVLRALVCERTELPPEAVLDHHRFLGDLHLNSITVAELMVESAARLGAQPPSSVLDFADATVAEAADVLRQLPSSESPDGLPAPGIEDWVRIFGVEMEDEPADPPPPPSGPLQPTHWELEATPDHPLRIALERILPELGGDGLLVAVDRQHSLPLAVRMVAAVRSATSSRPILFVQDSVAGGASGFARSLFQEVPGIAVKVVGVPFDDPRAASWIADEARAAAGFTEVQYDGRGRRLTPVLQVIDTPPPPTPVLNASDVLLATGGGKGIGAECALALAAASGCRVALLGRSDPADGELSANLARFAAAGVDFRYLVADVTDRAAVEAALQRAEVELGPITGLLHAAGSNQPVPLGRIRESDLRVVLGAKWTGLDILLAALEHRSLRLVLGFGSVIARSGLGGEAHYALANEWMRSRLERHRADHPDCRCICAEWSVWSGIGMGERLSTVDLLRRRGVVPITPERGLAALPALLALASTRSSVVISSRLGGVPTVRFPSPELPFVRFVERPEVFYPGVELVAEAELGMATDLYLEDHILDGEALLPAVMGLEAMAQVARALVGAGSGPVTFERAQFARSVVVPRQGTRRIRLAALLEEPDVVRVALRSEATGFQADHFRGRCRFGKPLPADEARLEGWSPPAADHLEPARDLYGKLLFQRGRFQRIRRYRRLGARACSLELTPAPEQSWFAPHLPGRLLLGDPGARDAALHALQACLPHLLVLPTAVEEIRIQPQADRKQALHVRAAERSNDENSFLWDLEIRTEAGSLVETWIGLRLQKVAERAVSADWPLPLLGAYVERRVHEAFPSRRLWVELSGESPDGERIGDLASRGGDGGKVLRRGDGKPGPVGLRHLSAAHSAGLGLAIATDSPAGCDLERIEARALLEWSGLLGIEGIALAKAIACEVGEGLDAAGTRVWAAMESVKKAGLGPTGALVLGSRPPPRTVVLRCGSVEVVTLEMPGRDEGGPLIAAFAAEDDDAGL